MLFIIHPTKEDEKRLLEEIRNKKSLLEIQFKKELDGYIVLNKNNIIIYNSFREFISNINRNNNLDNKLVYLKSYYKNHEGGSGFFRYDENCPRKYHDGGIIIDPTIKYPDEVNNKNIFKYFWNDGIKNKGKGCWIRITDDNYANVKWFGAKGDGINDDIEFIQQTIAVTKNKWTRWDKPVQNYMPIFGGIILPNGKFRITKSIKTNYYCTFYDYGHNYTYDGCDIIGTSKSYSNNNIGLGTKIIADFYNNAAILITGDRGSIIKDLTIVGKNIEHIKNNKLGYNNINLDYRKKENWIDDNIKKANGDKTEKLYAGILIDAKGMGGISEAPSSAEKIINVEIIGFVVGIALGMNDIHAQTDFIKILDCNIDCCTVAVALGHTQHRNTGIDNCVIGQCHTFIDTVSYGDGNGKPHIHCSNTGMGLSYQIFNINPAYGAINFNTFYCESTRKIGHVQGWSSGKNKIIFNNCQLHLTYGNDLYLDGEEILTGSLTTIEFNGGELSTQNKVDKKIDYKNISINWRVNSLAFEWNNYIIFNNTKVLATHKTLDDKNLTEVERILLKYNSSGILCFDFINKSFNNSEWKRYKGFYNVGEYNGRDNIIEYYSYYKINGEEIRKLNNLNSYINMKNKDAICNREFKDFVYSFDINWRLYGKRKYYLDIGDIVYFWDKKAYGIVINKVNKDKDIDRISILIRTGINKNGKFIIKSDKDCNDYMRYIVNRYYLLKESFHLSFIGKSNIVYANRKRDWYNKNLSEYFTIGDYLVPDEMPGRNSLNLEIIEINDKEGYLKVKDRADISKDTFCYLCVRKN